MVFGDLYDDIMTIVSEVGVRANYPRECKQFLEKEIAEFTGDRTELLEYFRQHVKNWFRCIGDSPEWIQEACWQFSGGKPMIFAGQIDIPESLGIFHDDARLFVFVSDDGDTKIERQTW